MKSVHWGILLKCNHENCSLIKKKQSLCISSYAQRRWKMYSMSLQTIPVEEKWSCKTHWWSPADPFKQLLFSATRQMCMSQRNALPHATAYRATQHVQCLSQHLFSSVGHRNTFYCNTKCSIYSQHIVKRRRKVPLRNSSIWSEADIKQVLITRCFSHLGSLHLLLQQKNNQNRCHEALQFPHANTLNLSNSICTNQQCQWWFLAPTVRKAYFLSLPVCTSSTTTSKQFDPNHKSDMRSTAFNMWFLMQTHIHPKTLETEHSRSSDWIQHTRTMMHTHHVE